MGKSKGKAFEWKRVWLKQQTKKGGKYHSWGWKARQETAHRVFQAMVRSLDFIRSTIRYWEAREGFNVGQSLPDLYFSKKVFGLLCKEWVTG